MAKGVELTVVEDQSRRLVGSLATGPIRIASEGDQQYYLRKPHGDKSR